jgi:dethiobiotin synthetase
MNGNGVFITGTDTGVGKTLVTAAIAGFLRDRGVRVGVMKPVTSGCAVVDGKLISEDAEMLKWASGCTAPDADIAPYLLKAPLAPSVAAAREGVQIQFDTIYQAYQRLAAGHEFMLVEGVGGLLAPLAGKLFVADLCLSLQLPLIIVARASLGTVNHTLLTCYCARQLGIKILGIIINQYLDNPGPAELYAPQMIAELSGFPVFGTLPQVSGANEVVMVEKLVQAIKSGPLSNRLLKELPIG